MDERLTPIERLRKREEIRSVTRQRKLDGNYCILYFKPNGEEYSRFGVIVSRAVGKAVVRNKVKRRLREIFRRTKCRFRQQVDLVIRAKGLIREATFQEIAEEIQTLLKKRKLLQ